MGFSWCISICCTKLGKEEKKEEKKSDKKQELHIDKFIYDALQMSLFLNREQSHVSLRRRDMYIHYAGMLKT